MKKDKKSKSNKIKKERTSQKKKKKKKTSLEIFFSRVFSCARQGGGAHGSHASCFQGYTQIGGGALVTAELEAAPLDQTVCRRGL